MRRKQRSLPNRFVPRFFEDVDGRLAFKKRVQKRFESIKEQTGADSIQKELLCRRAAFLSILIETLESEAMEDGEFDMRKIGRHTQAINSLQGVLSKLGLKNQSKPGKTLKIARA